MIVNDTYEFSLAIDGKSVVDDSMEYSFSISDSIHEIYPRMAFSFNDLSGLLQEFLLTTEGLPVQVTFGIKDAGKIECRFVIQDDDLENSQTPGIMNGELRINLVHEYHNKQSVKSTAYNDRISSIVRTLINRYSFNSININDTGNKSYWYQPMTSDVDFMKQILLPYAYSKNADNTPFFMFIDSNNEFNFRNFTSLFKTDPVAISYYPEIQRSTKQTNALTIGRFRTGSSVTYPIRRRALIWLDRETGELHEEDDHIYSYPSNSEQIPIVGDNSLVTGYLFLGQTKTNASEKEIFNAPKFETMKDSLFLDRLMIGTYLNTDLRAGKTITLDLPTRKTDTGDDLSLLFRGKYLIEDSKHVWNGKSKSGYTKILVSRRGVNVPDQYQIKGKFIKK